MSFQKATGQVVGLDAAVDAIQSFLAGTVGWTLQQTGVVPVGLDVRPFWALKSTGETGLLSFYVRLFSSHQPAVQSDDVGNMQIWPSRCYCNACSFCDQPDSPCKGCAIHSTRGGWCWMPNVTVQVDRAITWWCFADKDAFLVVMKSGPGLGYYHYGYYGLVNQFRSVANDPHPLVALGSGDPGLYMDYTFTDQFPFTTTCACNVNRWWFRSVTDASWLPLCGVTPFVASTGNQLVVSRWCNMANQPSQWGQKHTVMPIMTATIPSTDGARGELKHVFHVSRRGLIPEGSIDVGGNAYIVFPRTDPGIDPANLPDGEVWLAVRNY